MVLAFAIVAVALVLLGLAPGAAFGGFGRERQIADVELPRLAHERPAANE